MKKLTIVLFSCLFAHGLISQSDELDSLILDKMETYHVPGLAAAIITPSGICWEGYFGMANFEEDRAVDTSTIFLLASVSKTITASAVLKLHQEGYFGLDDDINSYLPFEVYNPYFPEDSITFRHLLTHKSSIRDHWPDMDYVWGEECELLDSFIYNYFDPAGELYHADLHFDSLNSPGGPYEYCNMGFALLGYLVEVISGTPFNEYCNTNLFDEMEMNISGWFLSDIDTNIMAMPYEYNTSTQEHDPWGYYCFPDYPDGLLKSSPRDLSNFLLTYIQGGMYNDETSILDPATVELLTPNSLIDSDGLTWRINSTGAYDMWGHSGAMHGVRTRIGFNPQDSIGVIVLTNGESNITTNGLWGLIKAYAIENCINADPNSTAEIEKLNRVEIFPNPNNGLINIELGSLNNVAIKVLNVSGQLIYYKENINSPIYQIELDASPGIYILELSAEGEKQQFKLVKQ